MWNNYIVTMIGLLLLTCVYTQEKREEERRGEDVFCLVVEFSEVTLMNSLAENIQTKTQLSSIREQARNASWRWW